MHQKYFFKKNECNGNCRFDDFKTNIKTRDLVPYEDCFSNLYVEITDDFLLNKITIQFRVYLTKSHRNLFK